jgi:hypothetical protein
MSDKLANIMAKPLASIDLITINKELDASQFPIEVCERLLSTHAQSDWRILNPIRARQAALINDALIEDKRNPLLNNETVMICPSDITSGMLINHHGCIGRVVAVERYEQDDKCEPFVYCVKTTYLCGDLDMHNYFVGTINNGTSKGYLRIIQGNRRASFIRVIEQGE